LRNFSSIAKKINARIGKAIYDYQLIEKGDRILVAVSGGKDSLTLLNFLKAIQGWAPVPFELVAAHIETDFHCGSYAPKDVLKKMFSSFKIKGVFKRIKALDDEKKTSCFWCSWNRRRALFEIAKDQCCNKVALGHHKDDIAETTLMNLLCNGEISSMNPRQEMFAGEIVLIRPLCYVEERMIKKYAQESGFPKQLSTCSYGKDSKRELMKQLIGDLEKKIPGTNIKTNIFKSLSRIKEDYIDFKSS